LGQEEAASALSAGSSSGSSMLNLTLCILDRHRARWHSRHLQRKESACDFS
jgi:hypothetical protein